LVNSTGKFLRVNENKKIKIHLRELAIFYPLNEGVTQIDFSGTVLQLMAALTYLAAFINPNPKRGFTRKPAEFSCQSILSYFSKYLMVIKVNSDFQLHLFVFLPTFNGPYSLVHGTKCWTSLHVKFELKKEVTDDL
jgi:hypothetical protein